MFLRTHKPRNGAAAVEFAIVAPLLFFGILFPMVEFGRALMVSNFLAGTAMTGCRTAVLPGNNNAAVTTAVNDNLAAQGISGATTMIKVNGSVADVGTAAQGDSISVTVSVPYGNVAWLSATLTKFLSGKTLSSTQTMRHE